MPTSNVAIRRMNDLRGNAAVSAALSGGWQARFPYDMYRLYHAAGCAAMPGRSRHHTGGRPMPETLEQVCRGAAHVTTARLDSPLGPLLAGATAEGICLLEFDDRPAL